MEGKREGEREREIRSESMMIWQQYKHMAWCQESPTSQWYLAEFEDLYISAWIDVLRFWWKASGETASICLHWTDRKEQGEGFLIFTHSDQCRCILIKRERGEDENGRVVWENRSPIFYICSPKPGFLCVKIMIMGWGLRWLTVGIYKN